MNNLNFSDHGKEVLQRIGRLTGCDEESVVIKKKNFNIGSYCIARVHVDSMTEGRDDHLCIISEINKVGFRKVHPVFKDKDGFYCNDYWRWEPSGRLKEVEETQIMRKFSIDAGFPQEEK